MNEVKQMMHNDDSSLVTETFPAIATCLPHRHPMLLLDAILSCSDETVEVRAKVDANAWYADGDGAMPAWIGIELMAQAIAAQIGLLAMRGNGRARPGVLLGSRSYVAHLTRFPRDASLLVRATELLRSDAGHGAYECTIMHGDECCAEGIIKVFQPDDFESFIGGSFSS